MRSDTGDNSSRGSEEDIELLFGSVFRKHQQPVFALALRVTKSPQQAADIVQEVFLKLWEHRSELGHISNVEAWLMRVVKNKLIDFLRKASADDRLRASLWKNLQHSASAELLIEAKESGMIIHKAIEQLPPQRKAVYSLSRESGLSYQEIARELSISRHTVKNQLSLALRFLQKKFSPE